MTAPTNAGPTVFAEEVFEFPSIKAPDQRLDATRLTDDEHYRVIQTVLRESVTEVSGIEEDTAKAKEKNPQAPRTRSKTKKLFTDRPEVSRTIRLQNPLEAERTVHRLPSRSVSVPSDSASLEKKKARGEDYSLDHKDYRIVAKAGEGGSGVVYEAFQIALKRKVAVKVLKQRRMKAGSRSRTRTKELEKRKNRFLHEVHVTAKLQHPNIIPLYDLGINHHGEVFYAMKLINEAGDEVQQQSWASLVRTSPRDSTTADIERNVQIFEKVCDAMRYAHSEQIVHRDLKPDNVMVGKFGEVLVIDWGMALDLSEGFEPFTAGGTTSYMPPEMGQHYLKQSEIHKLSHKLMVALGENRRDLFVEAVLDRGTSDAASELLADPSVGEETHRICREILNLDKEEQFLARKINFSSDIYLLGAILYEIAVGHPPHFVPQETCKSIEEKHHREFWLSSNHHIQRLVTINDPLRLSLCNIALGALQLEQSERYQSVGELQDAITGFKNQVQSLQLVETGRQELTRAEGGEGYHHLLPALESFRGAQSLWPEGEEARQLQTNTACEYARRANHRKDFDAGLSILDEYTDDDSKQDENVVTLKTKLVTGKKRAARNRGLATIGWVAAVVLPIGVWVASWLGAAELRKNVANLKTTVAEAEQQVQVKQAEITQTETELQKIRDDLKLQTTELQQAQLQVKAADDKVKAAETRVAQAQKEVDDAKIDLQTAKSEVQSAQADALNAQAEAMTAQTEATAAKEKADAALVELKEAESKVLAAKTDAEIALQAAATAAAEVLEQQKTLERLSFESAEGRFNSEILPIPLDLRKGKLELVRSRVNELRKMPAQFKNGWVARHFAKVVNVSGVSKQLGKDTSVIQILDGQDDALIVVGRQQREFAVWKTDSRTGDTLLLELNLPSDGQITSADISPDGRWLALALEDFVPGRGVAEHLRLIDLETGQQIRTAASQPSNGNQLIANDGIIGCKLVGFVDDPSASGQLRLVTVEELSGYKGLKERLQLVTRSVTFKKGEVVIGEPNAKLIAATTRDQGSVRYAAAMNHQAKDAAVSVVYQSLDSQGREILVLEAFAPGSDGGFEGRRAEVERFPTAMHVDAEGRLFCGFADGRIDVCAIRNLDEGATRVANEHESAVTVLSSTRKGKVVGGSADGVLIVFDNELKLVKRLLGQEDRLTSVAIAESGDTNGFRLASGGARGFVRIWRPDGTAHDASIRKQPDALVSGGALRMSGDNTVTCGGVDRHFEAGDVPATAYGTADGRVFYFDPAVMQANIGGKEIPSGLDPGAAKLSVAPPPGSFDTSFDNFDSFGIVDSQFVLFQADGKLLMAAIDVDSKEPSSDLGLIDATGGAQASPRFVPLLASLKDHDYFFTNSPTKDNQILFWNRKPGASEFGPTLVNESSPERGRIKQLRLSPDGNWLAVIREVGRVTTTGEYVTEILKVDPGNPQRALKLASTTNRLDWKEIDPRMGIVREPELKLPQQLNTNGRLVEFELSPLTENYLAMISKEEAARPQVSLWALNADEGAKQLTTEEGFESSNLSPISVSFSEIAQPEKSEIGTRMVVLTNGAGARPGVKSQTKSTRIYTVADSIVKDETVMAAEVADGEIAEKRIYSIFEIEGVIEVTDGRQLIDSGFSGDGKSLLEVDDRGLKLLLSQNW